MLDRDHVDICRKGARELARNLHKYIDRHTSESIEAASLRALGVQGDYRGQALTQVVIEKIGRERLREGAAYWLGFVMVTKSCDALTAAHEIAKKGLPEKKPDKIPHAEIRSATKLALKPFLHALELAAKARANFTAERRRSSAPFGVVIGTGDVATDIRALHETLHPANAHATGTSGWSTITLQSPTKAESVGMLAKPRGWRTPFAYLDLFARADKLLAHHGASHCARSEAIATHKKNVHPPATKDAKADEPSAPYVVWNAASLHAPELATLLATSHFHALEYDMFTQTRATGVHFKRAIVDQQWIYRICAKAGLGVHVRTDLWERAVDTYAFGHELIMGQIVIEGMAQAVHLPLPMLTHHHGLVIDTPATHGRSDRISYELAHAQLIRELLPNVPLSLRVDAHSRTQWEIAALIGTMCDFSEFMIDAWSSAKSGAAHVAHARAALEQVWQLAGDSLEELQFMPNGKIHRRANTLLERMQRGFAQLLRRDLLKEVESHTEGLFVANLTGAGESGVLQKHKYYWNPFEEWLAKARPEDNRAAVGE